MKTKQNNVLIAYGTRYGATEETAKEIQKILVKNDFSVTIINLKEVKQNQWPQISEFSGVIVGSSIKIDTWTKEAKLFLQKNAINFRENQTKLAVFVSSLLAGHPDTYEQSKQKYITDVLADFEISSILYDAFGGLIDFTKQSKIGFMDKIVGKIGARMYPDLKALEIDMKGVTDLRDWNQINAFGERFVELMKN